MRLGPSATNARVYGVASGSHLITCDHATPCVWRRLGQSGVSQHVRHRATRGPTFPVQEGPAGPASTAVVRWHCMLSQLWAVSFERLAAYFRGRHWLIIRNHPALRKELARRSSCSGLGNATNCQVTRSSRYYRTSWGVAARSSWMLLVRRSGQAGRDDRRGIDVGMCDPISGGSGCAATTSQARRGQKKEKRADETTGNIHTLAESSA